MICITFDTDWMSDDALAQFLEQFDFPGSGTFFAHRRYESLVSSRHEVGPHPFISDLEAWRPQMKALAESLGRTVRGTRTHSCVFSHRIGVELAADGYEYISQANNLYQQELRPFRHPWGVWELPIYYMDNMDFWAANNLPAMSHPAFDRRWIEQAVRGQALYVFDFHPIHVALNTRQAGDYQAVKNRIVQEGVSPFDLAYPGRGARTYFEELCAAMQEAGVSSVTCAAALDANLPGG